MNGSPILARLEGLDKAKQSPSGWRARCPAHEDKGPSLSWKVAEDGKVLVHCQAGCSIESVVDALGAEMADLFASSSNGNGHAPLVRATKPAAGRVARTKRYRVVDVDGREWRHVRHEDASGRKAGDAMPWDPIGGDPKRMFPFGSEDVAGWDAAEPVVVVEGEHTAEALLGRGWHAVATFGTSYKPIPEALAPLGGRDLILWPDADDKGREHMLDMVARLASVARSVRWVDPPADVFGGWDAADADAEQTAALLAAAAMAPTEHDVHEPVAVLPPPNDPMAVARELVAARFAGTTDPIIRHWRGEFWRWQGSHWLEVADPALRAEAYAFTEHATYVKGKVDEPWAPNRYKIADLVDALKAITHLSETVEMPAWLDESHHLPATELVACANGLLHVPTRNRYHHDQAYFNRVSVPFDYQVDAAPPTRWLQFLAELWPDDPEAIEVLAEFMGYVISGRRNLHKILLLIGPTRAGKGVIARVLKALLGRGNYAGPTLASLGTNFGLSPLIGKPLAIVSDARLGGSDVHQVVERLLSISGEDMLTVDVKYREPWTGTLPTRFLVISNELPRFGDASGAIANRFVVLTLHRSWLDHEDPELTDKLLIELPGILNWVLDGLARLNARGRFTEPTSSRDAIMALADLVSPTSAFVRDRCDVGPLHEVLVEDLYAAWKEWTEANGHRPGSVQTFGTNLRAVLPGLKIVRPRDGDARERHYRGVRLTTTHIGPDRGPARTTPAEDAASFVEEDAVRTGPRPNPLWPLVEDDYPASAWDPDGDAA
jgi:putative DNA primase/helicase